MTGRVQMTVSEALTEYEDLQEELDILDQVLEQLNAEGLNGFERVEARVLRVRAEVEAMREALGSATFTREG